MSASESGSEPRHIVTRARLDLHAANTETAVDRFYTDADSLFVRAYDAFYRSEPPQIAGDVAFYASLARESGGACSRPRAAPDG